MDTVIKTVGLTKAYGKFKAVDNVSLSLKKGDIYGLIGKNGAGKSTLFKLLSGLSNPTSGEMSILNSTTQGELRTARKAAGFLMGGNFYPYLNAKDNLEYMRQLKGITDREEVERVLKIVDLNTVTKPFKKYSMGMKQRLGIANALLGNPKVVILDEPVNGLDPQGIADIRKVIMKINREYGTTFLISSHILGELSLMANVFGFIHEGRLLEEITQEELHKTAQTTIIIKVDNPEKAATIIEQQLGTINYKISNNNELHLFDHIDKGNLIAKELVNNDVAVYSMNIVEGTLEDHYLELIGGAKND